MKKGYIFCSIAYIIAIAVFVLIIQLTSNFHSLISVAIADICATIVIFIFSITLNNSSIYDPYWSIFPLLIAVSFFLNGANEKNIIRIFLIFFALSFWAVRLTLNWIKQWKGLKHEDWRYQNIRKKTGKFYWIASFLGIHFFPTVVVYLGCLPLYVSFSVSQNAFSFLDVVAFTICISAVIIEIFADKQMFEFRNKQKKKSGEIINNGLWKYSRHPNYFGEILFWFGLYVFSIASDYTKWWTFIGPVSMILLFCFISIPMMEKYLLGKYPKYVEYKKKTSPLIPFFPKEE